MSREIRFRAWDRELKRMRPVKFLEQARDGQLIIKVGEPEQVGTFLYPTEFYLMQYTGLKDKNGKEIYEGDILEVRDSAAPVYNAPMEWQGTGWWITDGRGGRFLPNADNMQIIGNIYENPELIKTP